MTDLDSNKFPLTNQPSPHQNTFLDAPYCGDLDALDADIAIIGIPHGMAYDASDLNGGNIPAPDDVRTVSARYSKNISRYDFDFGGPLFNHENIKLVDVGNVPADVKDMTSHFKRAELAVRKILKAGALPIVLGGDHAIPIPVMRAYEGRGPIVIVQIDAHLDWLDQVNGIKDGLASPMRRASEMEHFTEMFQIGLRGTGGATEDDVRDALEYGSNLITANEVIENGMQTVLDRIPDECQYYITIDADGFDPSVMPAVGGMAPGGILLHHAQTLIRGLACKGRVLGMDIVELKPCIDVNSISSLNAVRLIMTLIGTAVREGYFSKK